MTSKRAHRLSADLCFDGHDIAKALRIAPGCHVVPTLELPTFTMSLLHQSEQTICSWQILTSRNEIDVSLALNPLPQGDTIRFTSCARLNGFHSPSTENNREFLPLLASSGDSLSL